MPQATSRKAIEPRRGKRKETLVEYVIRIYGAELDKANAEIHRLVVLLSGRPHGKGCHYLLGQGDRKCNCWKAGIRP
jgi:hypothetical protein